MNFRLLFCINTNINTIDTNFIYFVNQEEERQKQKKIQTFSH